MFYDVFTFLSCSLSFIVIYIDLQQYMCPVYPSQTSTRTAFKLLISKKNRHTCADNHTMIPFLIAHIASQQGNRHREFEARVGYVGPRPSTPMEVRSRQCNFVCVPGEEWCPKILRSNKQTFLKLISLLKIIEEQLLIARLLMFSKGMFSWANLCKLEWASQPKIPMV